LFPLCSGNLARAQIKQQELSLTQSLPAIAAKECGGNFTRGGRLFQKCEVKQVRAADNGYVLQKGLCRYSKDIQDMTKQAYRMQEASRGAAAISDGAFSFKKGHVGSKYSDCREKSQTNDKNCQPRVCVEKFCMWHACRERKKKSIAHNKSLADAALP